MTNLKCDLLSRGFVATGNNGLVMEYAFGSISHYTKCKIHLNLPQHSDMSKEVFYPVHLEKFAESGDPITDYHDITHRYIAESKISAYLKSNGIWSKAEREAEREAFKKRIEERRRMRAMR